MRGRAGLVFTGFLVISCSATDPGVEGLTRGQFSDSGSNGDGSLGDGGKKPDGAVGDSGNPLDSGSDSTAAATAFTGAGAFVSNQPPTTAVQFHMNNNVGVTPGLGQDCLSCHKNGGSGTEFLFGGTVFQDKAGTMAAADKEIRVLGSDNVGYSAHSDADGNYWFKKGATGIAFPAMSGVRDAAQTALMSGNITVSNCNGCHDKNTTDPLHIP